MSDSTLWEVLQDPDPNINSTVLAFSMSDGPEEARPSWEILPNPSKKVKAVESPLKIDEHEFVVMLHDKSPDKTQKFNIQSNQWAVVPLADIARPYVRSVVGHDAETKTLYVEGDRFDDNRLMALDSETGSIRAVLSDLPIYIIYRGFLIGDELHLFGPHVRSSGAEGCHLILNKNLEERQEYHRLHSFGNERVGMSHDLLIHSESRNSILSVAAGIGLNYEVAEYSLVTKEWKTLRFRDESEFIEMSMSQSGIVCTADGRYVIIFGGNVLDFDVEENGFRAYILVYDLNEETINISALLCPVKGMFCAISMTDKSREQLSTFGFVRQCFGSVEFKGVPLLPNYITELITKWVEVEYVYLLQRRGYGHWRIRVEDILKSVV